MKKIWNIFVYFMVSYYYINLAVFYILFILLKIDYGKQPDDNVLITKSKYYHYISELSKIEEYEYLIFLVIFILISLRLFKIYLISIKQDRKSVV